jgi:hypothetical protein
MKFLKFLLSCLNITKIDISRGTWGLAESLKSTCLASVEALSSNPTVTIKKGRGGRFVQYPLCAWCFM